MDKIKLLCIIIIIFACSGCTIESNIKINSNGTVEEQIKIVGSNDVSDKDDKTIKKEVAKEYDWILEDYKYDLLVSDKIKVNSNKQYSSLTEYSKSELFKMVFEESEVYVYKGIVNFQTLGHDQYLDLFYYEEPVDSYYQELADELKINIQFENIVTEHNADKYDEKTNTYTWIFTKDDVNKTIKFSYDSDKLFKEEKTFDFKNITIIVGIILIVIAILVVSFMFKYHNKDEL